MASVFTWKERYGSPPGTVATADYVHLLGVDGPSGSQGNYADPQYAIKKRLPVNYSYERWVFGQWSGTYNSISNVIFYKSAGTVNTTDGWALKAGTAANYQAPTNEQSLIATTDSSVWSSPSGALSLTFNSADGTSSYVVLQASVPSTAPHNSTLHTGQDLITYKIVWDET